MAINAAIVLSDVDNTTLAGATVTIANFVVGQDVLGFVNVAATMGNIRGHFNSMTGVMSLFSVGATATLAQWKAAPGVVSYSNSSRKPSTVARKVTFTVDDGQAANHTSNSVSCTINITP